MAAGLIAAVCLLATFTLSTPSSSKVARNTAEGSGPLANDGLTATTVGGNGPTGNGPESNGPAGPGTKGGSPTTTGQQYDCSKGQNAGATDVGVTPTEIRFASTVVTTGPATGFLADAVQAMEAVKNKVNREGGICGRKLSIDYKDDGWDSGTGQRYIESFIGDHKYFGLAVNPSSEGLRGAIDSGLIRDNGFPVIGSDGQLIDQYTDPWVWPVATSTASVMHTMVVNAWARGARTFGIVYDTHYRFGVEGHSAFTGAVKRLGGKVNSEVGVDGAQGDFGNQAKQFVDNCGGSGFLRCDFVAMLLEPASASSWVLRDNGLGDGTAHPKVGVGVPQPLFVNSFARDCKGYCAHMWALTSFNPPIPPFDDAPAVSSYRSDLAAQSRTADASNPHVQGAYVGMMLLVRALKILGPAPTRKGMKQLLDSMNGKDAFATGMAPPISFSPGNHYGNVCAQAFEDIVSGADAGATFANWRYTNSDFLCDKEVGRDVVSG
jgi:ABC-type branched-subunit amino acid transport system substrate-binding protein